MGVVLEEGVVLYPVLLRPVRAPGVVGVDPPLWWSRVGAYGSFIPAGCRAAEVAVVASVGALVAVIYLPVVAVADGAVVAVDAGDVDFRAEVRVEVVIELLLDLMVEFLELFPVAGRCVEVEGVPVCHHGVVLSPAHAPWAVLAAPAFLVVDAGAVAVLAWWAGAVDVRAAAKTAPVAAGSAGPVAVRVVGVVEAERFPVRVVRGLVVGLVPVPLSEPSRLRAVQAKCLVEVMTMVDFCAK